jgi:hypothetical protein
MRGRRDGVGFSADRALPAGARLDGRRVLQLQEVCSMMVLMRERTSRYRLPPTSSISSTTCSRSSSEKRRRRNRVRLHLGPGVKVLLVEFARPRLDLNGHAGAPSRPHSLSMRQSTLPARPKACRRWFGGIRGGRRSRPNNPALPISLRLLLAMCANSINPFIVPYPSTFVVAIAAKPLCWILRL